LTGIYEGELPALSIIDVILSKENALAFDLWGADAPVEQFRSFVPQTLSILRLFIATPLGKYQPVDPLNPSSNRWTLLLRVNYSHTPSKARNLTVYQSVHDQSGLPCRRRLRPYPKAIIPRRGHASLGLLPALWVSADGYYNVSGETNVNGVSRSNGANTLRLGAGMGLNVWSGSDFISNG
jgi:hypothetical protein